MFNILGSSVNVETVDTGGLALFLGGFMLVIIAFALVAYLLTAFAYYKMAKNDDHETPWFAFIPILSTQVQGEILREKLPFKNNAGWKYLGVMVTLSFLSAIPLLGILAALASMVVGFWVMYQTFDRYSEKALLFLIISILTLGIGYVIILFAIRNNEARW